MRTGHPASETEENARGERDLMLTSAVSTADGCEGGARRAATTDGGDGPGLSGALGCFTVGFVLGANIDENHWPQLCCVAGAGVSGATLVAG